MRRIILLCILAVAVVAAGADVMRRPRRAPPPPITHPSFYKVPRSVGAVTVIPDMSTGPVAWWSLLEGRPFYESVNAMVEHDISIIGVLLQAHPTENIFENIRKAFRTPGVDVIVITPMHWASTEPDCNGLANLVWLNYPTELFEWLYQTYGNQQKTIIVLSNEDDWKVTGIGCTEPNQCIEDGGNYDLYFNACVADTLIPYQDYLDWEDCAIIACDMVDADRANYLLNEFNRRQAASEAARTAYPDAILKVLHGIEVAFFDVYDEPIVVARDIIPRMDHEPDMIGLSLYQRAGDVVAAFNNVLYWTGLPAYRVFISEVGAREGTQPECNKELSLGILGKAEIIDKSTCGTFIGGTPQYDRIVPVVTELFDRGSPFAMVWSFEEVAYTGGHTGRAVIDAVTGEHLSGFTAIQELNEVYR